MYTPNPLKVIALVLLSTLLLSIQILLINISVVLTFIVFGVSVCLIMYLMRYLD